MNGLLLDTHVLLWALENSPRLSPSIRESITDPATAIFVSAASLWEMAIKRAQGRLTYPEDILVVLSKAQFGVLDVTIDHALALVDLPHLHKDIFDRMLIVQARLEGLTLVTSDQQIAQYDVRVMLV